VISMSISVCVCLSVCLSVREHIFIIFETTRTLRENFCACYPWPSLGLSLAALRYVIIHFDFIDDVMFAHNG